jgi:hypothetical protein
MQNLCPNDIIFCKGKAFTAEKEAGNFRRRKTEYVEMSEMRGTAPV